MSRNIYPGTPNMCAAILCKLFYKEGNMWHLCKLVNRQLAAYAL